MSEEVTPFVSVVITTYKRPNLAKRAIDSVLTQTYTALEIIVVEDGPPSELAIWLQKKQLPQICYVHHEQNQGLAAARNTGLQLAVGEYIAYLDDDDEWLPERIAQQIIVLNGLSVEQKQKLGVIYCGVEVHYMDEPRVVNRLPVHQGNLRHSIIQRGISTLSSTFLFKTAALRHVGGFDETLYSSIDHDIWMSLAVHNYDVYYVDKSLVINYYRHARRSMINDVAPRLAGIRQYIDKWTPVYQQWFGPAEGTAYMQRYFARVVGRLVARKLVTGNVIQAGQATIAVFRVSPHIRYNLTILLKDGLIFGSQQFLPSGLQKRFKRNLFCIYNKFVKS